MKPLRKRTDLPPSRDPQSPRFYDPDWAAWEQPRRWPQRLAVAVIGLAVVALVINSQLTTSTPSATSKVVTSTTFPLPGSGSGQIAPIHFSGSGTATTKTFSLVGGVTIFQMHCKCAANFAVALTEAGAPNRVLVNATAAYKGVLGLTLPAGTYGLTVAADFDWDVTITQPRNEPVVSGTSFYTGTGAAVIGPVNVAPTSKFLAVVVPTISQDSNIVFLPTDGAPGTTALVGTGRVYEVITSKVPTTGAYYLAFNNGGYWSITVK